MQDARMRRKTTISVSQRTRYGIVINWPLNLRDLSDMDSFGNTEKEHLVSLHPVFWGLNIRLSNETIKKRPR